MCRGSISYFNAGRIAPKRNERKYKTIFKTYRKFKILTSESPLKRGAHRAEAQAHISDS